MERYSAAQILEGKAPEIVKACAIELLKGDRLKTEGVWRISAGEKEKEKHLNALANGEVVDYAKLHVHELTEVLSKVMRESKWRLPYPENTECLKTDGKFDKKKVDQFVDANLVDGEMKEIWGQIKNVLSATVKLEEKNNMGVGNIAKVMWGLTNCEVKQFRDISDPIGFFECWISSDVGGGEPNAASRPLEKGDQVATKLEQRKPQKKAARKPTSAEEGDRLLAELEQSIRDAKAAEASTASPKSLKTVPKQRVEISVESKSKPIFGLDVNYEPRVVSAEVIEIEPADHPFKPGEK